MIFTVLSRQRVGVTQLILITKTYAISFFKLIGAIISGVQDEVNIEKKATFGGQVSLRVPQHFGKRSLSGLEFMAASPKLPPPFLLEDTIEMR